MISIYNTNKGYCEHIFIKFLIKILINYIIKNEYSNNIFIIFFMNLLLNICTNKR